MKRAVGAHVVELVPMVVNPDAHDERIPRVEEWVAPTAEVVRVGLVPDGHGASSLASEGVPVGNDDAEKARMATTIRNVASRCLGTEFPPQYVEELMTQVYRSTEDDYGIEAAVEAGGDFEFPQEAVADGVRLLREARGSLDELAVTRQREMLHDRLNHERIDQTLSAENPEKQLLHDLVDGIRVPTAPGFTPNGNQRRPPLRQLYTRVHHAVHKMLWGLVEGGLAVLLPLQVALAIVGIHFIAAHWAAKKGKMLGRPITDASDESTTGSTLNGPEVKAMVDEQYGVICHPTIEAIILMYLCFMDSNPELTWDDVELWKCDIRAAFTLLFWRPEAVKLFAMELVGGLAIVFLSGTFGWTGTPAAFQVVTRALVFEFARVLLGMALMYVDDAMGISKREDLFVDIATVRRLITSLLGPLSFAEDKVEHTTPGCRRLDNIGYTVDIKKQLVTISRRNHLKTTYGFLTVDETRPVRVSVLEKLASWASRYGKVCPLMRPFISMLYGSFAGLRNHNVAINLGPETVQVVWFFRAILVALMLDEGRFARPFWTFRVRVSRRAVRFDSSLRGVGILVGNLDVDDPDSPPVWFGGGAVSLVGLGFGTQSRFQNLAEFIGVIVVAWVLAKLGLAHEPVELQGDSVTALTWALEQRYQGKLVTRAAILYTVVCAETGGQFNSSRHLSSEENKECDGLSRGLSLAEVGLPDLNDLHLESDNVINDLIMLCKPVTIDNGGVVLFEDEDEFVEFWQNIRSSMTAVAGVALPSNV